MSSDSSERIENDDVMMREKRRAAEGVSNIGGGRRMMTIRFAKHALPSLSLSLISNLIRF
jgi:hypothetical protein